MTALLRTVVIAPGLVLGPMACIQPTVTPVRLRVTAGDGPRFGLLVHPDDGVREYAYDRESEIGRLALGLDESPVRGWAVVSMKNKWKRVFAFEGP
jgi:hypothetical protein